MGYVANKPSIKVVRDGETVELKVGDPFPEVTQSPNFSALLRTNSVVFVPDESVLTQGGQPSLVGSAQMKAQAKPVKPQGGAKAK